MTGPIALNHPGSLDEGDRPRRTRSGREQCSVIGKPLQIGPVRLRTNVLLAPVAGYCDLAYRLMVRRFDGPEGGVGLACTDLLSPDGLLRGGERSLELARTCDEDRPVGMQLYGAKPEIMAEGARWAADHGATVVDINMGCPVDKVCKKDGGSKLMCDPGRAAEIAARCRAALPDGVPLTAKMRLGWTEDDASRNAAGDLARALCDVGVAAITVHGRTTVQKFKGRARRDGIRRVVDAVGVHTGGRVPVIGNGDVSSGADCVSMLRETGCGGVMIARAALSKPWLFTECWRVQLRATGRDLSEWHEPDDPSFCKAIARWFNDMLDYRGEPEAMHVVRQRISGFGKHINGSHCRPLKEAVRTASDPAAVHRALEAWAGRGAGAANTTPAMTSPAENADFPDAAAIGLPVETADV